MGQKVEAEGRELVLRSEKGHIAIIPKDKAKQVKLMIELEDYDGVNELINTLPLNSDYAQDGTLHVGDPTVEELKKVEAYAAKMKTTKRKTLEDSLRYDKTFDYTVDGRKIALTKATEKTMVDPAFKRFAAGLDYTEDFDKVKDHGNLQLIGLDDDDDNIYFHGDTFGNTDKVKKLFTGKLTTTELDEVDEETVELGKKIAEKYKTE
jgi:hypothetical protein